MKNSQFALLPSERPDLDGMIDGTLDQGVISGVGGEIKNVEDFLGYPTIAEFNRDQFARADQLFANRLFRFKKALARVVRMKKRSAGSLVRGTS